MTWYSIALFLHVVGALGFFAGLGLEWMGLLQLRRAGTAERAIDAVALFAPLRRLYPTSGALMLVSGIYLSVVAWGAVAWIVISLVVLILLAVSSPRILGPRLAAIGRAAHAETGQPSPELSRRLRDPLILAAHQIRTALALGIVFLMTVKPDLLGALLAIGIAVVLGLVWSLPTWTRSRTKEQPA